MAKDLRPGIPLPKHGRPRIHVVDGTAFVSDEESAAFLLSEHRIKATPIGVRPARNESPEETLPYVLSPQQTTLVLRRNLADVFLGFTDENRLHCPIPAARIRFGDKDELFGQAAKLHESDVAGETLYWKYPETLQEARSMAVFEDLWERGVYVAGGSNYGADYVVYDGPPTETHSIAAVLVSRGPNGELSPAEISGFSRVQQAVAKRAVIASPPLPCPTRDGISTAGSTSEGFKHEHQGGKSPSEEVRGDNIRYVTLQFDSVSGRTM